MSDLVAELSQRALELAPEDRARLAEELLASLDTDVSAEGDAAWDAELRQRIADVDRGAVGLLSADGVFARVRSQLR
jgi:putative addiction module component (TIGR02574 family)